MEQNAKIDSYIEGKLVNLRDVEISDAEFILSLRLNPEKNRFLHSTNSDIEAQKEYLRRYKEKTDEYYWIIEGKNSLPYGVVRIYDFQKDSFCPGSWITKPGVPITVGTEGLFHAFHFGFFSLDFENAHYDVRKANKSVVRFHKKIGAVVSAEDEDNYYFFLTRQTFTEFIPIWSSLLGFNL